MNPIDFEENVAEIAQLIAAEKFGAAGVYLHGLIYLFPKEVFLRERLAEVYAKLGDPISAGHYWYLVENKTPQIEAARRAFEDKHENDLLKIFNLLLEDFKYEKENVIGTAAEKPLRELQEKAFEQQPDIRDLPFDFFAEPKILSEKEERETEWFVRGCIIAIGVVLVLAIIGFFTILRFLQ